MTFIDPDPSVLPIIHEFNPCFEINQEPLPQFVRPRVVATKATPTTLTRNELAWCSDAELWSIHDAAHVATVECAKEEASLLDLKIELARRALRRCELCGQRCAVNRQAGQLGRCGLGTEAYVYEAYLHIAEEAPVNPAFNISLRGCGLRCRYCQQFDALAPRGHRTQLLTADTWGTLDMSAARSLAFVGGNPTESLPSVLEFMHAAPSDFSLPVVWNSSGYDSTVALRLLRGVCDAYIPDCKYGNDVCATALSNAAHYTSVVTEAIEEMCAQNVPVFVRMLVLPGHVDCCHLPVLEMLAPWKTRLRLNVMAHYLPDFLIGPSDGLMARRMAPEEPARVRQAAKASGFDLMFSEG